MFLFCFFVCLFVVVFYHHGKSIWSPIYIWAKFDHVLKIKKGD